ncbi:MAG: CoA transferase [Pseudomonadales bacterium]|nr:CoA transferase [Pseudomonadales bacterium]
MAEKNTSLEGITVLDLGQIYNGPYATFLMAMAGARVIKVEALTGETLRGRGPSSAAGYPFTTLNQNKESITLNLKSDQGRDIFKKMVSKADVVLENYSPDAMKNFGLSAATLLEINPRLVYACGSGYGREGPHRDYLAMDLTVQAMSGIMSLTGFADSPPLKSGVALCDFFGGVHLYGAIITQLFERNTTGKGGIVDVAMQDAVLPTLASAIGAYYYNDRQLTARTDNRHPALTMAPYNVYQAADGHVSIICVRNAHWRGLLKAIDRPELLDDQELATMDGRATKMQQVDAIVTNWTRQHSKSEILEKLQQQGVPSAMVRNIEEILHDPHLLGRGMLKPVQHPIMGDITLMNSPINIATGSRVEPTLPPDLGEHNQRVYKDFLDLGEADLAQLIADGVIGRPGAEADGSR